MSETLKSIERAIHAAYTGSAEHGSFFRGETGEYTPSVFMLLDNFKNEYAALAAEHAALNAEHLESLKAEGQKDQWIEMLSTSLRNVIAAVTDSPDWEGSVAEGLDLLQARIRADDLQLAEHAALKQRIRQTVTWLKSFDESAPNLMELHFEAKELGDFLSHADKWMERYEKLEAEHATLIDDVKELREGIILARLSAERLEAEHAALKQRIENVVAAMESQHLMTPRNYWVTQLRRALNGA